MKWRLSSSKCQIHNRHNRPCFPNYEVVRVTQRKLKKDKILEVCLKMQYVDFRNFLLANRLLSQASPQMTAQCCISQVKH